jgi:gentisate 1,2-dioxygenase
MDSNIGAPAAEGTRTVYTDRARYFTPQNAFNRKQPPVPAHVFEAERARAFDPATPTGFIPLDVGAQMDMDYPATAPHILSRYAVIRAGESLRSSFRASGEVYFVIKGNGETRNRADTIRWSAGDVFSLPGGAETEHRALGGDAILYLGTDEPALAFNHLQPPAEGDQAAYAVHFTAGVIDETIRGMYEREPAPDLAGHAIFLSTEAGSRYGTFTPAMISTITTLDPGSDQRPHRHNAVAVQLCIEGEGSYAMCDGKRIDLKAFTVSITPPGAVHSLHNRGDRMLRLFIMQDSGMFYYYRTTGFSFGD